jgi:FkbM family methyltransferase
MINSIKSLVPASILSLASIIRLKRIAKRKGLDVKIDTKYIDIISGLNIVRISARHEVYLADIINSFDYYFSAVIPFKLLGSNIVDYSTPRYHDVIGYDKYPIFFPSFCEPLITTSQYMDFAKLSAGMTVIDLGAYSGLTSIIFSQAVGATGTVVAVDADIQNIECIKRNFSNYLKHSDSIIFLLEGAVWNNNDGLDFSCEGNMGSSAESIVGNNRGLVNKVPSFTLNSIADKFNLQRVDFIKCDVEGAESVIFQDQDFFQNFLPRIIIETHIIDDIITTEKCILDLTRYGYSCRTIFQDGVSLPLLECLPPIPSRVG